jgi:hypothetical protein
MVVCETTADEWRTMSGPRANSFKQQQNEFLEHGCQGLFALNARDCAMLVKSRRSAAM